MDRAVITNVKQLVHLPTALYVYFVCVRPLCIRMSNIETLFQSKHLKILLIKIGSLKTVYCLNI